MKGQTVIDTDAHVEEGVEAWKYLEPAYADRRPVPLTVDDVPYLGNTNAFWLVDGKLTHRPIGRGANITLTPTTMIAARAKPMSIGAQELTDVDDRVREMKTAGVDVQVIFPSIFNRPLSEDPRLESALHRAYNTWLAETCARRPERLKWVAVMPLQQPEIAAAEARRAHALGAVGALAYPMMGGRLLDDPALEPFFRTLDELDLPLCMHVGWYIPALTDLFDTVYMAEVLSIALPSHIAFACVMGGDLFAKYPHLRVGMFEAGASWLPYFVERLDRYHNIHVAQDWSRPLRKASEYLAEGRLFLTFEPDERLLPQVIDYVGPDQFLLSTDMPHSELRESAVEEVLERTDLADAVKRKIFYDNAVRFFGPALGPPPPIPSAVSGQIR